MLFIDTNPLLYSHASSYMALTPYSALDDNFKTSPHNLNPIILVGLHILKIRLFFRNVNVVSNLFTKFPQKGYCQYSYLIRQISFCKNTLYLLLNLLIIDLIALVFMDLNTKTHELLINRSNVLPNGFLNDLKSQSFFLNLSFTTSLRVGL